MAHWPMGMQASLEQPSAEKPEGFGQAEKLRPGSGLKVVADSGK